MMDREAGFGAEVPQEAPAGVVRLGPYSTATGGGLAALVADAERDPLCSTSPLHGALTTAPVAGTKMMRTPRVLRVDVNGLLHDWFDIEEMGEFVRSPAFASTLRENVARYFGVPVSHQAVYDEDGLLTTNADFSRALQRVSPMLFVYNVDDMSAELMEKTMEELETTTREIKAWQQRRANRATTTKHVAMANAAATNGRCEKQRVEGGDELGSYAEGGSGGTPVSTLLGGEGAVAEGATAAVAAAVAQVQQQQQQQLQQLQMLARGAAQQDPQPASRVSGSVVTLGGLPETNFGASTAPTMYSEASRAPLMTTTLTSDASWPSSPPTIAVLGGGAVVTAPPLLGIALPQRHAGSGWSTPPPQQPPRYIAQPQQQPQQPYASPAMAPAALCGGLAAGCSAQETSGFLTPGRTSSSAAIAPNATDARSGVASGQAMPRFGGGAGGAALGQVESIALAAQAYRVTDGAAPICSPGRMTPSRATTPVKTPRRSTTPVPVSVENMVMAPQASQGRFQYGANGQNRATTPRRDASLPVGLQLNTAAGTWNPSLLGTSSPVPQYSSASLHGASHPLLPGTAAAGGAISSTQQHGQQQLSFARPGLSNSPSMPGMPPGAQPSLGADLGFANPANNACSLRSVSPAYLRQGQCGQRYA